MRLIDGRVLPAFIDQKLRDQDLTIFGDGTQTQSFQYVDDLVEWMIRMLNSENSFLYPINLGNPNEFKMLEFAEKEIKLTESSSKNIFMPLAQDYLKNVN